MFANAVGQDLYEAALRELARGNNSIARGLMSRSAKLDHLPAISTYALMLEHGIGGKASMVKAIRWLKLATERGDCSSSLRLGLWFIETGNFSEAKHWLSTGFHHPRAALYRAYLFAKSRSCRATTAAKRALASSFNGTREFSKEELEARWALVLDFRKRNPSYDPKKRARPYRQSSSS